MKKKAEKEPLKNPIKRYINHLKARGFSPRTIKEYLRYVTKLPRVNQTRIDELIAKHNNKLCKAALISYMAFLHKNDIIIKLRKRVMTHIKPTGLSVKEYNTFRKALMNDETGIRNQLITDVMVEGGFRVSEVIKDVNDDKKGVRPKSIKGKIMTLKLKGNRWDDAVLSKDLIARLNAYIKLMKIKENELLFPIGRRMLWKICDDASKRAGMRHVHPHLLKHTTAKRCDEAKLRLEEKSIVLHHLKPNTTWDHYHNPETRAIWSKLRKRDVHEL